MNNNEHKLVPPPEELPDDALDKVAGGSAYDELIKSAYDELIKSMEYRNDFISRNNCTSCSSYYRGNCPLHLRDDGLYTMYGADPNAMCPYKT